MRYALLLAALTVLLAGCAVPFADDRPANPDNETIGYHDGYWYDDEISINTTDGLNETEQEIVAARTSARVEEMRHLNFEQSVEIEVVSRSNFTGSQVTHSTGTDANTFEDVAFEAMFLVGNDNDAVEQQQENNGNATGGFYNIETNKLVVISESETPRISVDVLAHELVHALQDQHFDLNETLRADYRDTNKARLGLIEGDATAVQNEYNDRCGEWECIEYPGQNGSEPDPSDVDIHMGVYISEFFPYSDGPAFVNSLRDGDSWSAVNAAFDDPPESSREIIYPEEYGSFERVNVSLTDRNDGEWERLRPDGGPDYDVLGQSSLTAMFAYTLYDQSNPDSLVTPIEFINQDGGELNRTDPLDYDLAATRGWAGDRLHVYERGNETGYVWRLAWDSPAEATEFTEAYQQLLRYWGGEEIADETWRIGEESQFTGAYRVHTNDDTVTITHSPTAAGLDDIRQTPS